jgi:DNA-directed RNA polymerase subunit RPC12/RpoP
VTCGEKFEVVGETEISGETHICDSRNKMANQKYDTKFKPDLCTVCGKKFNEEISLTLHLSLQTALKNVKCEKCSKIFLTAKQPNSHLKVCSTGRSYTCNICKKTYTCPFELFSHKMYIQV